MNLWRWISNVTARLADRREPAPATPPSEPAPLSPRSKGAGRPLSSSLARTMELAAANPSITPIKVAEAIGVSRDYARTLLRRARQRSGAAVPPPGPYSIDTAPPAAPAPALTAINLTPRARALHFLANGDTPHQAAAKLGVPAGEVEFIHKIHRLLNSAA